MGTAGRAAAVIMKRKRQKLPPKKSTSKLKTEEETEAKSSSNKSKSNGKKKNKIETTVDKQQTNDVVQLATASQQLNFFIHQYQSGNGVQLSSLELDSLKVHMGLDHKVLHHSFQVSSFHKSFEKYENPLSHIHCNSSSTMSN